MPDDDPGALLGDMGFGTQAEIRFGSRIPVSARKPAFEGYAFWDHAIVRNLDRLVVTTGSQHLNSVGGGALVNFDRFALDAALAIPLTRVGLFDKKPDPRLLISLRPHRRLLPSPRSGAPAACTTSSLKRITFGLIQRIQMAHT